MNWNNAQTSSNEAYGASIVDGYNDCIAILNSPSFRPNQYAQATVSKAGGYSPSGSHEIELLLRFSVSPHDAHGYEILWGITGYIAIVRWNGPLGDYTPLYDPGNGSISIPADGDVLRAEIVGNTITVYKNGILIASATDSTYPTGQPGMGFWPKAGATLKSLGWKNYQAGSL